ncbi:B-cell CLL/lymphoma 7 protein family member A-like isoform X2 [Telopea speciosissima]|uniref:B-cell CLL/lymphoma 7 protein family member A-like isoform X2 n=1 Tax=Telopea speciosissima TaxID=54955 RepID=UPI001CC589F7|nr:B-cell CLL/lymphoma 7 protein family member A-like isoform X2 [Telopea speciosissima]
MEGVGARLGRSSTRYGGPTTVFSGPVRKWKKKWIHVSPSNTANHHSSQSNGTNGSHLLLYKWTPLSQSNNNSNNGDKTTSKDDNAAAVALEEPPRRKFRYVPIAVLEEQNREAAEKADEEGEPSDTDPSAGAEAKSDGSNGKPDINDVPMEEAQASVKDQQPAPQELSETNLDLSLGLKAHDGDHDADPKREKSKDGQPERVS